jgi:hypothetical protein
LRLLAGATSDCPKVDSCRWVGPASCSNQPRRDCRRDPLWLSSHAVCATDDGVAFEPRRRISCVIHEVLSHY